MRMAPRLPSVPVGDESKQYSVYYKEENVQCQGTVHIGLVVSVMVVYTICYTLVLSNFLEAQCQGTLHNPLHFGLAVLCTLGFFFC